MKRARLSSIGWAESLVVEGAEGRDPKGDEVVIDVDACGVCYRDCIDRDGGFAFMQMPITPGHEAAGRVVAVGPEVTEWRVGDRVATMQRDFCGACDACKRGETSLCQGAAWVLGLLAAGGYATQLIAPQRGFYAIPEGIADEEAAVLQCTFGTAYRGLTRLGPIGDRARVLVTGANGGVGTAGVQVAKRLGAEVIAVVRSEAYVAHARSLGADDVLVDAGDGFHKRLADKVDVVLDCVGPPTFNASLRSLRIGGRLVAIGNVVKDKVALNVGFVIVNGLVVVGSTGATRSDMATVLAMHENEPFGIPIHARMKLDEADAAQRLVKAGGLRGRVVILPRA